MLSTCLLCLALYAAPQVPALHHAQHVVTPSGSSPALSGEAEAGSDGMTQDQSTAMRLYSDTAGKATDTAIEAFGGAAKAKAQGYSDLAGKDLRLARHGVANTAIAKAETISGNATLAHPHDHAAVLAQYHEKMQQAQTEATREAGAAGDPAHRQFYETLAAYLGRIDANPGRYASTGGADALTGESR